MRRADKRGASGTGEVERFDEILKKHTDQYFSDFPHRATEAGIHDYDGGMTAFTRDRMVGRVDQLKKTLNELADVHKDRLPQDLAFDVQIFENKLKAEVLELTEIRRWIRDPNAYNDVITSSIQSLVDFHSLPAEARLQSVVSRLDKVPQILGAMKNNIENPAPVYVEVARAQFAETGGYLKTGLTRAFSDVQDAALQGRLKTSIEKASKAYDESLKYLAGIGPRAKGGHSLGSKLFQQKLFFEEMVDTPIPLLLKAGEDEMKRIQGQIAEAARKVDPGGTPAQVLASLGNDRPPEDQLASLATTLTEEVKKFVQEKNIASIPGEVLPKVRTGLPFRIRFCWRISTRAARWRRPRKRSIHRRFRPVVDRTSERSASPAAESFDSPDPVVHETYPGHYLQFLYTRQAPSRVRKLFGSEAFREGWAFYVEEMMLDEGYGNGDPKLRLGQLQFALLRHAARYVAAVRVHAQGAMTEANTVDFFMKEAYLARANADREANRTALDPTVLGYTLGKLEIVRLRRLQRDQGRSDFHGRSSTTIF